MLVLEGVCLAIVATYVIAKLLIGHSRRRFLGRLLILIASAWLAENSVIEVYGFYRYSPDWSLFVHHVPLLIVLIWPVVILSAWDLAASLLGSEHPRTAWLAGLFVLADASLIEPIAVHAQLWWWTEPGLFGVPPIGIAGWAVFAVAAVGALRRLPGASSLLTIPMASLATHATLLAAWWGLFRWINGPLVPEPFVAVLWLISGLATAYSIARRLRERLAVVDMMLRAPGAIFFFVLLATNEPPAALIAYAVAFAPPYLSLIGGAGLQAAHKPQETASAGSRR